MWQVLAYGGAVSDAAVERLDRTMAAAMLRWPALVGDVLVRNGQEMVAFRLSLAGD